MTQANVLPRYRCHKVVQAAKIIDVNLLGSGKSSLTLDGDVLLLAERGYIEKHNPQPGGYFVLYEDGYQSYSPAAVFEAGYTRLPDVEVAEEGHMTFSHALEALKMGKTVCRAGWNGKGQYVVMVKPGFYDVGCSIVGAFSTKAATLQPFLALKNAQDLFQPGWVPSMGDLMSPDWMIYEPAPADNRPEIR
ncbi:DUF2829 domain-containing protein [Dickeya chrysanthemi]|uniref:DUF2829 domain-containing protein n=1 Tax=Dickeya chrysanthemi TaxID=556 RepID=UPI003018155A